MSNVHTIKNPAIKGECATDGCKMNTINDNPYCVSCWKITQYMALDMQTLQARLLVSSESNNYWLQRLTKAIEEVFKK